MINQEEKKCQHECRDSWTKFKIVVVNGRFLWEFYNKKDFPICPFCKPSEAKQEPKSQCCNAVIDISGCPHLCTKCWKPMTNIKIPEESKFSEDDFKYYTDTIVRIMKNAICKQGSTPNDAIDELNSFFAQSISAERNANAEKITKLEKQMEIYRLETIRWSDAYKPLNEKAKSLESKLAESENQLFHQTYKGNSIGFVYDKMVAYRDQVVPLVEAFKKLDFDYSESGKDNKERETALFEFVSRLEAEAKSVRSKTEELLKALDPIRQGGYGGASFIVQEAIRALNSEKE